MNPPDLQVPSGAQLELHLWNRFVSPCVDVLVSEVGDELVLLDLGSEQYFGLNAVGRAMWQRLTTSPSVSDAVSVLLAEYDVDRDQLLQDIAKLLDELVSRNLVELRDVQAG